MKSRVSDERGDKQTWAIWGGLTADWAARKGIKVAKNKLNVSLLWRGCERKGPKEGRNRRGKEYGSLGNSSSKPEHRMDPGLLDNKNNAQKPWDKEVIPWQ